MKSDLPEYVVLDFETTGFDPSQAEIIEIAAIRIQGFEEKERFHRLVKPHHPIPLVISQLTGIDQEMVKDAPPLKEIVDGFADFLGDLPLVAHNASMEQRFLDVQVTPHCSREFTVYNSIDPLALIAADQPSHSLEHLRLWAGIQTEDAHRADQDCVDLLKVLEYAHAKLHQDRKHLIEITRQLLWGPQFEESWWWNWFFQTDDQDLSKDTTSYFPQSADLGDLKKLRAEDDEREIEEPHKVDAEELREAFQNFAKAGSSSRKVEYRQTQVEMARAIAAALEKGASLAVEAPTGTGKSLAYLAPGVLSAKASGVPLIVSTHSKSLQDQLLQKDIPLLKKMIQDEQIRATTVKGQNNYFCLRKLHDLLDGVGPHSPVDERWSVAYLLSIAWTGDHVEVDRASRYLIGQFEPLKKMMDQVRSHHTTTLGPGCPFYESCHFFNSARVAHQSEVVIANHSLVFQWPSHLPRIRHIVFDEAHHLEDQITEAHSVYLSEYEISDTLNRLSRSSRSRRQADLLHVCKALERSGSEEDITERFEDKVETARHRLAQLKDLIPLGLRRVEFDSGRSEAYEEIIELNPLGKAPSKPNPGLSEALEGFRNLHSVLNDLMELLSSAVENSRKSFDKEDLTLDITKLYLSRFERFTGSIGSLLDEERADQLRLIYWNRGENEWRIQVSPIEISELAKTFFSDKRAIILTSATLTAGKNRDFILKRIGFGEKPEPSEETQKTETNLTHQQSELVTLPSPYALENQARVFIPRDMAPPGTPSHFESLVDFIERTTTALGGKTLALFTSNRRLRFAAEILRERLTPKGYTVFDSPWEKAH